MILDTLPAYLKHWAQEHPDQVWLRDLKDGQEAASWTWSQAHDEVMAVASALEERFGHQRNMVILSRNRAHWVLADNAVIASGNVTVSMFTTLPPSTAEYVVNFTDAAVVFYGGSANWEGVREILPEGVTVVALPGTEVEGDHLTWEQLLEEGAGKMPRNDPQPEDLVSLVFTSGTTGVPKGVMQTHASNLVPIQRGLDYFGLGENPQLFSYLPLSHIAERQLVEFFSMVSCAHINFNESLETLVQDLQFTRPAFLFGPPRVWEQFQQAILGKIGGQEALSGALAQDKAGMGELIRAGLGLDQVKYCLTAAAPTPPALIHWFDELGIQLLEGFGQTEAMFVSVSTPEERRIGSIGKPLHDVEIKLSEESELLVKAEGCTPGYYKMPEKTAELLDNGWLHTGDKAKIDEDGFIYITGRVKDYFKTIQGKFVAPTPIENEFAANDYTEQQCLLGRGYSKTVMTCVLAGSAAAHDPKDVEAALLERVHHINETVDHHARVGAVIVSKEPWTIENEVLTPTLKIRREQVEERFGELARELATASAQEKEIYVRWVD